MNIYHISQSQRKGYDTYDSAVVVANSANEASTMHPAGGFIGKQKWFDSWASSPDDVLVKIIGKAEKSYSEPTVICASFNAG
jgi:hypothetical protein